MKRIPTTIFTNFMLVLGVVALCSLSTAGKRFPGNIIKTFEFGKGTELSRSNVRTFSIPCHLEIAAVVKFQRDGPGNATSDVPILIELRRPDTETGEEGAIVKTESAMAKPGEQTMILRSEKVNRGCSMPWRVRVSYGNAGAAPVRVYGSIRFDFDDLARVVYLSGGYAQLKKGESTTYNFGTLSGLEQGIIQMSAYWKNEVLGNTGPNAVKLKFELTDPGGTVVKTVSAYSSDEARQELTRFNLTYQVGTCVSGQWKMKITNIDPDDDAYRIGFTTRFTPVCPD